VEKEINEYLEAQGYDEEYSTPIDENKEKDRDEQVIQIKEDNKKEKQIQNSNVLQNKSNNNVSTNPSSNIIRPRIEDERPLRRAKDIERQLIEELENNNPEYYEEPDNIDEEDHIEEERINERPVRPAKDIERQIKEEVEMNNPDYYRDELQESADEKRFSTSDERLENEIIEQLKKNMGEEGNFTKNDKFQKFPIQRNDQGLASIRETVHDDEDSLKDSLMRTKQGNRINERRSTEEITEAYGESPSIDDVSDVSKEHHHNQSHENIIRAPQPYQEEKKQVNIARVHEEKGVYITDVKSLIQQGIRKQQTFGTEKEQNKQNVGKNQEKVTDNKDFQREFTKSPQKELKRIVNNLPEQQIDFIIEKDIRSSQAGTSNRFSSVGYSGVSNVSNLQSKHGVKETVLDIPEDIRNEEFYQDSSSYYRRESHPGNLSVKKRVETTDHDDFVDSTMDEKTLAMYMKYTQGNKQISHVNSKVFVQGSQDYNRDKKRNAIETQLEDELEETQFYDSVTENTNTRVGGSSLISRPVENKYADYLGDTMKSVELNMIDTASLLNKNVVKRAEENRQEIISAGEVWKEASESLANGNYEAAYSKILNTGDDIYLLRLLKLTGPCLKKLNRFTAMKLLKRIIALQKSNFFDKMALGFFESAHRTQVTHNMKIEDQNMMLKSLYKISSKSDTVGQVAANLHEVINIDLRTIG